MLICGRPRSVAPVRLFEYPDFEQAILQAAEYFRDQGCGLPGG